MVVTEAINDIFSTSTLVSNNLGADSRSSRVPKEHQEGVNTGKT